jgi:hypothetical protein
MGQRGDWRMRICALAAALAVYLVPTKSYKYLK